MFKKQVTFDHSITESGHIQVRRITRIMENGVEIPGMKTYHRHVISPGDDVSDQDKRTKLIAKAIHTPDIVKAYKDMIKENELE